MKAILTDVSKCIGCTDCISACKTANNLPYDRPRDWQKTDGLSASNWTSILGNNKHYVRKQCRHCIDPGCVSVCPVGALHKTDSGAVVYDKSKCLGCRYCMMACPYGIPRYDWDKPVPYVQKCILCHDKIQSGELSQPACTKACKKKATIYGEREDLLKIARKRISTEPGKYENHIYGETEVGGTNVLYITTKDCPLDFLTYYKNRLSKDQQLSGLPGPDGSIPDTTKFAMGSVPFAFVGMGAVMSGVYWVMKRKQKIEQGNKDIENENQDKEQDNG